MAIEPILNAFLTIAVSFDPPAAVPAAASAAPALAPPADRFDAMQREIEALRRKAQEQDEQIEQLKAQNSETWLTEQRAQQIREVVGDVLADSTTRASLSSSGAVAGYDKNFFLASADGNFRLNIEGQMQLRFAYSYLQPASIKGTPSNLTQVENEYGFELRRVKLNFFGHVFDPSWAYRVQFAYERDGQNSNKPLNFEDVYVQKALGDGWLARMGQWKTLFNYETYASSRTQQFAERSLVNQYFSQQFIQGILGGWEGKAVRIYGSYNDGGGNSNIAEVQSNGNPTEWATTWRVEWMPAGAWGQFRDMQGWRGSPFGAMLGLAVNWQRASGNPPSGRVSAGNGFIAVDPVTGKNINAPMTFLSYTADLNLRGDGWSVWAAFLGNWVYNGDRTAESMGVEDTVSYGAVVQGGVFLTDAIEIIARYEGLWVSSDLAFTGPNALNAQTLNILTTGFNYYFQKNAVKLTVDAGVAFNPVLFSQGLYGESISGADWRAANTGKGAGEVVTRVQMQLLF